MARFAAVDIGSNSIRMQAAEAFPGSPPRILISDRQVTRLGAGVFAGGRIGSEAMDFVCAALSKMASQFKHLGVDAVRAVATSAVRDARNQREFLARTSAALGAGVETISGQEEARLIHLGVQSRWPQPEHRALMIDIGGGSAEMILSANGRIQQAFSKTLGALRLTQVFIRNDPPRHHELHRLEEYIQERIAPDVRKIVALRANGIDRTIATSATASAVVCAINRIPRTRRDEADRLRAATPQIRKLYQEIGSRDLAGRQKITGIGPRRAEIIVAGAAVLLGILEALEIPALHYSAAGVRDGIIADLASRGFGESAHLTADRRESLDVMAQRYGVPLKHARKVARFAGELFVATQSIHRLPPFYGSTVEAAGYLHDIGHYVSDTRHHKHSYYLVANSDMPGFDQRERELIANLCRYHRKASPLPEHPNLQPLEPDDRRAVALLAPLLRLADSLDRSRDQRVESFHWVSRNGEIVLELFSSSDIDLEIWAVEQVSDYFRQVYNRSISAVRSTP